jgi:hypothetical protein
MYLYRFKIYNKFHIHEKNKILHSLIYIFGILLRILFLFAITKSPPLLLLNRCKLSYFIGYRCVDLI